MSDPLSRIPSGMRYFCGREARTRRAIEEVALSVFEGWSYEEITTPALDYYSLFEQGMGHEARNAFRFMDADGKLLALRPDVTSGVARAAVTLLSRRERPLRLWYVAPVFRQQAQSHAAFRRESTQIGCELFGVAGEAAEIETLVMASEILERLGLQDEFIITLNDVDVFNGVAQNLNLDADLRTRMRELVESRNATDLERFLSNFASPEESRSFADLIQLSGKRNVFAAARQFINNDRSQRALDRLDRLWEVIESLSLAHRFEIDLGDVSELDYYTALSFKVYVKGAGARVGGGGRYDNLTAKLGKPEPAIGFVLDLNALTDLVLGRSLSLTGRPSPVVEISEPDSKTIFRAAIRARAEGRSVFIKAGEVER